VIIEFFIDLKKMQVLVVFIVHGRRLLIGPLQKDAYSLFLSPGCPSEMLILPFGIRNLDKNLNVVSFITRKPAVRREGILVQQNGTA
jgi:hypothetical protein